jgi:transposase-like protein
MLWFRAIRYITTQKNGTSAIGLQRVLGIGSYKTAWTWLHKLRRAMVGPGRDRLSGQVEVDEAYIGAPEMGGKRGRGAENKVLTAVAVETADNAVGRIRIGILEDVSQNSLHGFIQDCIEPGSVVVTDGWRGYNGLEAIGYKHKIIEHKNDEIMLPHVHTVISLMKRWIMGTLQGSCSREHLSYYCDEYTFRFNRRKSKSRGDALLPIVTKRCSIGTGYLSEHHCKTLIHASSEYPDIENKIIFPTSSIICFRYRKC